LCAGGADLALQDADTQHGLDGERWAAAKGLARATGKRSNEFCQCCQGRPYSSRRGRPPCWSS